MGCGGGGRGAQRFAGMMRVGKGSHVLKQVRTAEQFPSLALLHSFLRFNLLKFSFLNALPRCSCFSSSFVSFPFPFAHDPTCRHFFGASRTIRTEVTGTWDAGPAVLIEKVAVARAVVYSALEEHHACIPNFPLAAGVVRSLQNRRHLSEIGNTPREPGYRRLWCDALSPSWAAAVVNSAEPAPCIGNP